MSNSFPLVSVILPVYNCEEYIGLAIDSILSQTYTNFELIIIDDCSTDSTPKILESYKDSRIRIIRNSKNIGISRSLNLGVSFSNGKLIARMDADDISLSERLKAQVEFMRTNPEIGVLGTQFLKIADNGEIINIKLPIKNEDIFYFFLFANPIAHPTVMIRKEILLETPYDNDSVYAEDYNLWAKLLYTTKFANLPDVFLHYRVWNKQVSSTKIQQQAQVTMLSRIIFCEKMGITESLESKAKMLDIYNYPDMQLDIEEVNSLFREVHRLNEKRFNKKFAPPDFAIKRFIEILSKISKIALLKNVFISQYLKENGILCLAFIIIFKKIAVKLRKKICLKKN